MDGSPTSLCPVGGNLGGSTSLRSLGKGEKVKHLVTRLLTTS